MKLFDNKILLAVLLLATLFFVSCRQPLKSNKFNIYINEDNVGWHFVDLTNDSIQDGYQKLEVKFAKGQKFQTATIRFNVDSCLPIFLQYDGDTIKSEFWFVGTYNYDPVPKTFVSFYVPTNTEKKTVKDYMKDSSYNNMRYQMDTIIKNYLKRQNRIK